MDPPGSGLCSAFSGTEPSGFVTGDAPIQICFKKFPSYKFILLIRGIFRLEFQ